MPPVHLIELPECSYNMEKHRTQAECMPHHQRRNFPTIGVLAGWQVYWTATPLSYLNPVLRGIRQAAQELGCNLLIACGMGPSGESGDPLRPAWLAPAEKKWLEQTLALERAGMASSAASFSDRVRSVWRRTLRSRSSVSASLSPRSRAPRSLPPCF